MLGPVGHTFETIEVVVVDDHALVRDGLRLTLEREPDLSVVAEADDLAETERLLRTHLPTVLLLDLLMRDESSLPMLPALAAASPSTTIVVLTMETHPLVARDALRRGATCYLSKQAEGAELIAAVRSGAARKTYLDPRVGAELALRPAGEYEELTERETEILRLVALGHTNAEIAARLYLSVRTVEAYRLEVQKKLALSSRSEVVEYVRTRRLTA